MTHGDEKRLPSFLPLTRVSSAGSDALKSGRTLAQPTSQDVPATDARPRFRSRAGRTGLGEGLPAGTGGRFQANVTYVKIVLMKQPTKRRLGRPAHRDDPPKLFSTTIPTSIYEALDELSRKHGRPKSELLTDAIRAYARRFEGE